MQIRKEACAIGLCQAGQQSGNGAIFYLLSYSCILSVSENLEFNENPIVFLQSLRPILCAKLG